MREKFLHRYNGILTLALIAIFSVALGVVSCGKKSGGKPEGVDKEKSITLNAEGEKLYRDKDYEAALEKFYGSIEADPHNVLPINNAARSCAMSGQRDCAIRHLELLVLRYEQDPDNRDALEAIQNDKNGSDFNSIREDPMFTSIMNRAERLIRLNENGGRVPSVIKIDLLTGDYGFIGDETIVFPDDADFGTCCATVTFEETGNFRFQAEPTSSNQFEGTFKVMENNRIQLVYKNSSVDSDQPEEPVKPPATFTAVLEVRLLNEDYLCLKTDTPPESSAGFFDAGWGRCFVR